MDVDFAALLMIVGAVAVALVLVAVHVAKKYLLFRLRNAAPTTDNKINEAKR